MFTISIRVDTMNVTSEEVNQNPTANSELYLLLITIKLSIFMALKIGQALVHLYSCHNKRVIDKHHNTSIARLQKITSKAGDNLEAGLSK